MDIILRTVLDVTAEMLLDLRGRERVVVDGAEHGVIVLTLVGEDAQEGAAACTWAAEYD